MPVPTYPHSILTPSGIARQPHNGSPSHVDLVAKHRELFWDEFTHHPPTSRSLCATTPARFSGNHSSRLICSPHEQASSVEKLPASRKPRIRIPRTSTTIRNGTRPGQEVRQTRGEKVGETPFKPNESLVQPHLFPPMASRILSHTNFPIIEGQTNTHITETSAPSAVLE